MSNTPYMLADWMKDSPDTQVTFRADGIVIVYVGAANIMRARLWTLSDYKPASVTASEIWLLPKGGQNGQT